MINPVDRDTIKAMTEYRAEQLHRDAVHPSYQAEVVVDDHGRSTGLVASMRQSAGMTLMRAGARLAGVGMHTRVGPQL